MNKLKLIMDILIIIADVSIIVLLLRQMRKSDKEVTDCGDN